MNKAELEIIRINEDVIATSACKHEVHYLNTGLFYAKNTYNTDYNIWIFAGDADSATEQKLQDANIDACTVTNERLMNILGNDHGIADGQNFYYIENGTVKKCNDVHTMIYE